MSSGNPSPPTWTWKRALFTAILLALLIVLDGIVKGDLGLAVYLGVLYAALVALIVYWDHLHQRDRS